MRATITLLFVLQGRLARSFYINSRCRVCSKARYLWSLQSSSNQNDGSIPRRSRLDGNTRQPTAAELAVMDEMITKLAEAPAYELPTAVRRAFRVISSPQFFLRIAERADQSNGDEKEKLSTLASNLVATLEVVVETTKEQLDERAKEVEQVVKAAAEPDTGEFLVPLLPERVVAMRQQIEALDESSLDDGFLSTLDAWIVKAHEDGMDLMVGILQKGLQLYAGTQISRMLTRQQTVKSANSDAYKLLLELLSTDADAWDTKISGGAAHLNEVSKEIRSAMESTVLQLEAGSIAQRVQAEYLQELMKRIEVGQTK